ncbi:MAG TPA: glucoamylase family protein, partial [Burkholderiales bacterium]|nr:glucoamylase family protein [Burkholderiales bacterium]
GQRIAPAGEWLLDNFYLIEEQVRTAQRHLPRAYSRELPRLLSGPSAGLPRAYDIALEAIAHGDGRVDLESLRRFVAAYQTVAPLKLGELWAIPIMLRLALLENLRRVASRLAAATTERSRAGAWADQMLATAANDPKSLVLVIADMARSNPPMVSPFVAELARRLQGQSAALALPLTWIEQRLAESGATIEHLVQAETQDQAADQVSMSNSIGSLRLLGATDWREFVEAMSVVERTLREDPVYAAMDFASRDRYRHVVEQIAKRGASSELDVARQALAQAQLGGDARNSHVGAYLVDKVRFRRAALPLYLGAIALASALFTWGLAANAHADGAHGWGLLLIALVSLLATSQLAVALVNRLAMALAVPHPLPKLDYSGGIPPHSRTLAVVPALLGSASQVEDLLEGLEVRFLANRDAQLHFGLLTDFTDAQVETLPQDAALEQLAVEGIEALNRKYGADRFFLFHRPRRWNPGERLWMGYERKRGKQAELNSLLRGGSKHRFSQVVGETSLLPGVKYVITLDTDTQLPRDAARELVGAMAHPLNRPRHDERTHCVCEGYAILQPRVAVSLPASGRSRYARLFGGESGIDPYTRTVSDVYQDLFGEGSFIGKGIYDVDAFERALDGRFRENRILSHDLLEGCHARSGLLSDVQLYEEYPSSYGADMSRRHRWMRGDWQIAHWAFAPLSALSRWKIFDNLRRSLAPAALVLLLLAGWAVFADAVLWTLAAAAILLVPPLIGSLQAWRSTGRHFAQVAFSLACLPYEALVALDALARTAWRMLIARRLLEWTPSGEVGRRDDLLGCFRAMWVGPALAAAMAIYLAAERPAVLAVAAPILLLWLASPLIAWWVSRPLARRGAALSGAQDAFLRGIARKTWSFFETFMVAEDHWLPPDNFQEFPAAVVAHRTSPTNMGLALLANLSAYDFGFITAAELIERTARTLGTMQRLERFHGHFYNWYDTRTLMPLPPLYVSSVDSGNLAMHLLTLRQGLLALRVDADVIAGAEQLAQQAGELAQQEYDFLFDAERQLLAIGHNVTEGRRDTSYYDLLASEARAASFVAIAQGELPQESWFALGRLLTSTGGETALVSWSGSMFEYLMPLLVMPAYEDTLLDQTCRAAVARQIAYGSRRGVPWGMSESGYNMVDAGLNYQYRAFGVPGLGLKRGLSEDLVIAPYASALALMVAPEAACVNLERLAAEGLEGDFGFYEAVDYTPSRVPRGQESVVVRSYMAHHQGMILLSLAHLLLERPMQQRFAADARFQATLLLLQERIPKRTTFQLSTAGRFDARAASSGAPEMPMRVLADPDSAVPQVQLLSNGRYHVMVTHAGGGYSRWKDLAVTRWREDATCDNWGSFCYVRDEASGKFWSTGHQPALKRADTYEAIFSEARAEFRRRDHDYDTHTEIVVSPEDDIELRRVRISNRAKTRRTVELTSYAEVVLAPPAADALHPAFSNLFVQTEIAVERRAILCTRRPRSLGDHAPWMFHAMAVHGAECTEVSYETDRARFIGRGRSVAAPQAMIDAALSGSQGSVLDPIVAIRSRITLEPGQSATIDMVSGIGESREAALHLAGKYQDRNLADRVFDLAWTHSLVTLRQINATESDAQLYGRLASSVLYANASLRGESGVLVKNRRGQSGLWGYGISGDLPIVLLRIGDVASIDLVRQLVQAHAYWRLKGLAVDLMIWNEDHAGYRQVLQDQIMGLIAAGIEAHVVDRPGGIFVRRAEQIADDDRILFQAVARAVLSDGQGTLAEQIERRAAPPVKMARLKPTQGRKGEARAAPVERDLRFFNGLGGFTPDGREYVITMAPGQITPAPWVNVLANPQFGSVISESGLAYTWSENAHESRLTPWGNDPVSDASGEAFYLRDEDSGEFWSPAPLPCRGEGPYVTRHGFGYSIFEHTEGGIRSELKVYVDLEVAVKYSVLKIANESGRARRLSATGYVEWVLGDLRPKTAMHVVTEIDPASGALCARNPYSTELAERVAFFDVDDASRSLTGDRSEFLGRNGTLGNPAALRRAQLSNRVGAAYDPCGAIQVAFELAPGQQREVIFRLGVAGRRSSEDAGKLARRLRGAAAARSALEKVQHYWTRTLGAVQVETPDPSIDVLANGWLVYQTLACRLWARSGYYQSGGAFGFRDQLQDSMALVHAEPALAREQLLRAASRQFVEGDVQHWWHPPSGRGVRTHCSDDFLWLPAAACRYVLASGDAAVLDEPVAFLEGRPVNPEDDSYYDLPSRSGESATLYEHCVRAILRGLRFGEHGLPLIGSGDWNDGMNMVGAGGKGESVWLGFFLHQVLLEFAELARSRDDASLAGRCRTEAERLRRNLEQHGWDGEWYRRAYFDDGTALGSAANAECQIDSIAQSWSVLSGAGDAARSRRAMQALDQRLVRREHRLVQLLDPPFDTSPLNPGYIKGYVPGVRENGGQYTHAAIWAAMAFAQMGDHKRAWELAAMINPVNHASSARAIAVYKVEPYAVAADVYAVAPHTGRGGWTWYTGSAGWMYRLIVESLLGLRREGDTLRIAPCLPADWPGFKLRYRYGDTFFDIQVRNDGAEGSAQSDHTIALVDDGQEHRIDVKIGVRPRIVKIA